MNTPTFSTIEYGARTIHQYIKCADCPAQIRVWGKRKRCPACGSKHAEEEQARRRRKRPSDTPA